MRQQINEFNKGSRTQVKYTKSNNISTFRNEILEVLRVPFTTTTQKIKHIDVNPTQICTRTVCCKV